MSAHSPNAYSLSLLIHGGFVGLLFLGAFVVEGARMLEKKPQIFELVAGEGDNYSALEAPALGTPTGVKIDIPTAPVIAPAHEDPPAAPEPSPVKPAPAEPIEAVKPPPTKPVKPAKKELTMAEKVEKIADQREKRIITKYRKEQERLEKIRAAEEAKRMSKAEFDRQNSGAGGATKKGPRIDAEGIAKGVVGGSTRNKIGGAGGKALTREEMDKVSEYYSILANKIRKALEAEGVDPSLVAKIRLTVAPSGGLGTPTILRTSGNAEFDQAVVRAIRGVGSIGRPHPLGRTETLEFEVSSRDM